MPSELSFFKDPDFFLISENNPSLIFAAGLLNSDPNIQTSKPSKVISTYKNTLVTVSKIIDGTFTNSINSPIHLEKNTGTNIKNSIFDIENSSALLIFGLFTSDLILENLNSNITKKSIHSLSIDFLSHTKTNKLTFKNLFNSIYNSNIYTENHENIINGISIYSLNNDSDLISGIYPETTIIRLVDDLNEEQNPTINNFEVKTSAYNEKTNIIDIGCSEILNSPQKFLTNISCLLKTIIANRKNILDPAPSKLNNPIVKSNNALVKHKDSNLLNDPDFFISGPPRCGTSLLSVLLNSHKSIAIAQDTGIYSEFINAAAFLYKENNIKYTSLSILESEFVKLVKERPMNLDSRNDTLLLNFFFTSIVKFLAIDFFIPDPRKDRGTGMRYLNHFDFQFALNRIKELNLPFKSILNYCVNSIIDGECINGMMRGEKTPTHILPPSFLRSVYPNAKFINIIRSPLGFVGSRQQRFNASIKEHCDYYRSIVEKMIVDDGRTLTVKYEDIIEKPEITINNIYKFLGVKKSEIPDILDPGSYPKYVGVKIDKNRDKQNLDSLSYPMVKEIKYHLNDLFKTYYPSLL